MTPESMLTALRAELDYDPETGVLMWKHTGKGRRLDRRILAKDKDGYIQFGFWGRYPKAHRVAWALTHGEWPKEIDHINGDPGDNRLVNLRNVSHAKNQQNQHKLSKDNTSGFMGVHPKRSRWAAEIVVDGRKRRLGVFATPEEAARAYRLARAETPA